MTAAHAAPRRRSLLALLLFACVSLVPWALLDQRPLNDHDPEFAGGVGPQALAFAEGTLADKAQLLTQRLVGHEERHPQLPQTLLLAWTGVTGWSRVNVRLASLPWWLLLLVGTWLAARQLLEQRLALLAAFLVGTLPVVQHMSRKWFPHFFAAALAPVALWLLLRSLRAAREEQRVDLAACLGFGVVTGLRLHCHPIGVPDAALMTGLLAVGLVRLTGLRRAAGALGGAVVLATLLGGPALFAGSLREGGVGFGEYLALVSGYLAPSGLDFTEVPGRLGRAVLPGAALFLLVPGFVGLVLPPSEGSTGPLPWQRFAARLLGLRLLVLSPAMLLTLGNGAYVGDWILLVPDIVLLAVVGLSRLGDRTGAGQLFAGVAAAQGLVTLVGPLVLGLSVADPLAPGALGAAEEFWGRSEHGGVYNTHHVPIRAPQPGAQVAAALGGSPPDTLDVLDLSWGAADCALPPDAGAWLWQASEDGFSAMPASDPFEMNWGRVPHLALDRDPPGSTILVRIWRAPAEGGPCMTDADARDVLATAAQATALRRLGGDARALVDHAQWFVSAPRPGSEPVPGYASISLLVTR